MSKCFIKHKLFQDSDFPNECWSPCSDSSGYSSGDDDAGDGAATRRSPKAEGAGPAASRLSRVSPKYSFFLKKRTYTCT